MSAARHLELVPHSVARHGPTAQPGECAAEDQFIGSLMWLDRHQVQSLLDLVPDTAIWQPIARWAYELIAAVTANGHDPTPVAVQQVGRHRRARGAIAADRPPTARQQQQFTQYLFEAYSQALEPDSAVLSYARELLDADYRRAFDSFGVRMRELAASGADRRDLTDQFAAMRDHLATLWRRAENAAQFERNQK